MSASKNLSRPPLARMLHIHERLQSGALANCRVLGEELSVSAKTIQRDIDFMRDQMGLPIDYEPSGHGFRYTRKVVQFPTMKISEGELVALSVARKALAQYRGTPYEKPLRDAFEKLTAGLRDQIHFAWDEDLGALHQLPRRGAEHRGPVHLRGGEPMPPPARGTGVFLPQAPRRRRGTAPGAAAASLVHRQQWYLFAADKDRAGAVRTFALTRMSRPQGTGERFERAEAFSLDEHLAGSFGAYSSPPPEEVRLRFDAFSGRLIRERTWHASQRVDLLADGGLEFSMRVGVSPEVERWILGWGARVEVLAPAELRDAIAATAAKMAARNRRFAQETPRAA